VGLESFEGDPAGIAAPAGAVRRLAIKRLVDGLEQYQADYTRTGGVRRALEHYSSILKSRRYEFLGERLVQGWAGVCIWSDDTRLVVLSLHRARRKAKMDGDVPGIVLTVQNCRR